MSSVALSGKVHWTTGTGHYGKYEQLLISLRRVIRAIDIHFSPAEQTLRFNWAAIDGDAKIAQWMRVGENCGGKRSR